MVCAASYEARRFGVRSAMPAVTAGRLCPEAFFVSPDFVRYKAVSQAVREIFQRPTDAIEPLSLDEAYLDVTENKTGLPTATVVAKTIRRQIREELSLTASAGIAPNKFLAKIASDWRKPMDDSTEIFINQVWTQLTEADMRFLLSNSTGWPHLHAATPATVSGYANISGNPSVSAQSRILIGRSAKIVWRVGGPERRHPNATH